MAGGERRATAIWYRKAMAGGYRSAMAAGLAAIVVVAVACSSNSSTSTTTGGGTSTSPASPSPTCASVSVSKGPTEASIQQVDFSFKPSNFTVKSGSTLSVKDAGSVEHSFDIDCSTISIVNSAGQSQTVKITLPPGTYRFFCHFHGTPTSGMHGTLTVT